MSTGDLLAVLDQQAPLEGANVGPWPGLTIYRFTQPTEPRWEEIRALSIGIVAQGRKAVKADGRQYVYDQFNYLVISSGRQFECQILEASPEEPCLCFVLEIEPDLVRTVSADMRELRVDAAGERPNECVVSALDDELMSSVLRFLRALAESSDRRVLAPLYLQEMVYRVLQREQVARMLHFAQRQAAANPVAAALNYITAHLAEPLTVTTLAEQVNLSPSAFSRLFRDVTGQSPYQFVKEMRLGRARELLIEGRLGVADVSRTVGYASVSHFIKEFRGRFGSTPRDFADGHLNRAGMGTSRAGLRYSRS
ncbi:MAG TPA: AraC family transcriptional regulator [Mycobacterium sp.]|nr:AraC family transcriptional regulator [Mycobacterium sp.]